MSIGLKIFLTGLLISVAGRILAQINNNDPDNRVWIGAMVGIDMVITFVGGVTWIAMY